MPRYKPTASEPPLANHAVEQGANGPHRRREPPDVTGWAITTVPIEPRDAGRPDRHSYGKHHHHAASTRSSRRQLRSHQRSNRSPAGVSPNGLASMTPVATAPILPRALRSRCFRVARRSSRFQTRVSLRRLNDLRFTTPPSTASGPPFTRAPWPRNHNQASARRESGAPCARIADRNGACRDTPSTANPASDGGRRNTAALPCGFP